MALMLTRAVKQRVLMTVKPSTEPQVIAVELCALKGAKARLGITADRDVVKVLREEVEDRTQEEGGAS